MRNKYLPIMRYFVYKCWNSRSRTQINNYILLNGDW